MTIQIKATEQYFPVAMFIILYKAVLTFEFVDGILKFDHSNKSDRAALSCKKEFGRFSSIHMLSALRSQRADYMLNLQHS